MARDMSPDEWRSFITEGTRTGKIATARADGSPHVVPIWFALDGDTVIFTTGEDSLKGRSLQRDPRVCLCVDDDRSPYAFVMIEGVAEVTQGADDLLHWATVIGGRYMGADRAEEYGRRNAVPGELLVRVRPTKVVAQAAVAD